MEDFNIQNDETDVKGKNQNCSECGTRLDSKGSCLPCHVKEIAQNCGVDSEEILSLPTPTNPVPVEHVKEVPPEKKVPVENKKSTTRPKLRVVKPGEEANQEPDLRKCGQCGHEGVSKKDLVCPKCGLNPALNLCNDAFAETFAGKFKNKYLHDLSCGWFKFQKNGLWKLHDKSAMYQMKLIVKEMIPTASPFDIDDKSIKYIKNLHAKYRADHVFASSLATASREPGMEATPEQWNQDLDSIGCRDSEKGKIDIRTGKISKALPNDYMNKAIRCKAVDKEPEVWSEFLWQATNGNVELINYLRQVCGYCLTGHITEDKIFLFHGLMGSGKSTFVETIAYVMGDYSVAIPVEAITGDYQQHKQWKARLHGKRLIVTQEPKQGSFWRSDILNAIISGETVEANFMNQNSFDFQSVGKIFISANHKPKIKSLADGFNRRLSIIGFNNPPAKDKVNKNLRKQLQAEAPEILNWMLEGASLWYNEGLQEPQIVKDALNEYLMDEDVLADFLLECFDIIPGEKESPAAIYTAYEKWCERNGMKRPMTSKKLNQALSEKGYSSDKKVSKNQGKVEKMKNGIKLKSLCGS